MRKQSQKKPQARKLVMQKETVRQLSVLELEQAVGGEAGKRAFETELITCPWTRLPVNGG